MAGALRLVSVQRGYDPRDFALVAFGGAGPMHANAVAKVMGSYPVIVPPAPGLLCAPATSWPTSPASSGHALIRPLGPVLGGRSAGPGRAARTRGRSLEGGGRLRAEVVAYPSFMRSAASSWSTSRMNPRCWPGTARRCSPSAEQSRRGWHDHRVQEEPITFATAFAWSGPAPPNATIAKSRGS